MTKPKRYGKSKFKDYIVIMTIVAIILITPIMGIAAPLWCNEIKNAYEENDEIARTNYGYDSFEEWNKDNRFTLDNNCWWILPWE